MNRFNKPWPHSPGAIAQVETHHGLGFNYATWEPELLVETAFEARIFGEVARFPTYERAVSWCQLMKDLHAEAELDANIGAAGLGPRQVVDAYGVL